MVNVTESYEEHLRLTADLYKKYCKLNKSWPADVVISAMVIGLRDYVQSNDITEMQRAQLISLIVEDLSDVESEAHH